MPAVKNPRALERAIRGSVPVLRPVPYCWLARALAARGQRDVEQAARLAGVVVEQLVEIAHPVEDERVGELGLDAPVLLHHGRVGRKRPLGKDLIGHDFSVQAIDVKRLLERQSSVGFEGVPAGHETTQYSIRRPSSQAARAGRAP